MTNKVSNPLVVSKPKSRNPALYVFKRNWTHLNNNLNNCPSVFDDLHEDEIEFRSKNWYYAGFLSRNEFSPKTDRSKKVKESDKNQISELKEYLQNSKYLMQFSQRERKIILNKGRERLIYGWVEIMEMAKFNKTINKEMYRLLSSHAHSTGLSIVNIQEMKLGYYPKNDQGKLILFLAILLVSRMITNLKAIIKTAEIRYNLIPTNITGRIEFYSK